MIDTHTHLYVEAFDEDRDSAIQNAQDHGVTDFFIPAIDSEYHQRMFDLEKNYPEQVHLMMGLHPTHVKKNFKEELDLVKKQLSLRPFSAIGEIGMDLYWDLSTLEIQKEAFVQQIKWAKEYNLPIVIHARESYNEIFQILDQVNSANLKGVFHCFSSNLKDAERILEYGGFKLGIGGVVTFKNCGLDKVVKNVDIKNIVLETDSPYLTPTPFRGTRNKSSYIPIIANKLSDIYEISSEEIGNITSKNAKEIFNF